jgi:hypothetical protein
MLNILTNERTSLEIYKPIKDEGGRHCLMKSFIDFFWRIKPEAKWEK